MKIMKASCHEALVLNDVTTLRHHIDHEGLDINSATGSSTWSLLHVAVYHQSYQCVKLLLDSRANINLMDDHPILNVAFFHWSAKREVAFLLIERGATTHSPYFASSSYVRQIGEIRFHLSSCRLAQRALERVLRGKVHRDIIPLIGQWVWASRQNPEWGKTTKNEKK